MSLYGFMTKTQVCCSCIYCKKRYSDKDRFILSLSCMRAALLDGKVIFITGWTSGIGRATVLIALREWARVVFTGRNQAEAERLRNEAYQLWFLPDCVHFIACDVTDAAGIQAAVEETVMKYGQIDGVFANAGRHMVGTVEETTLEQWRTMFAIDVEGVFLTLKYTIPHLKAWVRDASGTRHGGSVVLMWSDQCLIGKGKSSAYGAAKWAVGQLAKSTAIDYAVDNIRVNCICPGTIDTPLARGAMQGFADKNFGGDMIAGMTFLEKAQPMQRLGTAEEVAETVVFMLSDKPGFMTGSLISIDGGYVAG